MALLLLLYIDKTSNSEDWLRRLTFQIPRPKMGPTHVDSFIDHMAHTTSSYKKN